MISDQTAKDRGAVAVLKFAAEAKLRGFLVLTESSDNAPFDVVLYKPNCRASFIKVQVKSCLKAERGKWHFMIKHGGGKAFRPYTREEVDIFALHSFDTNDWWLIDVSSTEDKKKLTLDTRSQFLSNWELLNG